MIFRLVAIITMSCCVACGATTAPVQEKHEQEILQEVITALAQEQQAKAQNRTTRTAVIAATVSLSVAVVAYILYWLKKHQSLLAGEQLASPISNQSAPGICDNVPYPTEPPPPYRDPSAPPADQAFLEDDNEGNGYDSNW